jgi:hypothetical protein
MPNRMFCRYTFVGYCTHVACMSWCIVSPINNKNGMCVCSVRWSHHRIGNNQWRQTMVAMSTRHDNTRVIIIIMSPWPTIAANIDCQNVLRFKMARTQTDVTGNLKTRVSAKLIHTNYLWSQVLHKWPKKGRRSTRIGRGPFWVTVKQHASHITTLPPRNNSTHASFVTNRDAMFNL